MSGKHFNVHEVGCCIKYFIFGFNIIFWVSYVFCHCVWAVNVQSCILSPGVCIKTPLWVSDTLAVPQNLASCLPRQHCRTFQTRLWWPNAVERSKFAYENLICVECTEASSVASFKCHDTKKQEYSKGSLSCPEIAFWTFQHSGCSLCH